MGLKHRVYGSKLTKSRQLTAASLCVAAGVMGGQNAQASLLDFNAIVFNKVTGASEIEGRVAVGGNWATNGATQACFDSNCAAPLADDYNGLLNQQDGVLIKNNIGGANNSGFNMSSGINYRVGGVDNGGSTTGGGTLTTSDANVAFLVDSLLGEANDAVMHWAGLSDTAGSFYDGTDQNQKKFTSNAAAAGDISVINISENVLTGGTYFLDNQGQDFGTMVINVEDTNNDGNINIQGNMNSSWASAEGNVIWNLDAFTGDVNFQGGEWSGAVAARNANINMNAPLNGLVIAENLNLGSEVHLPYLDGGISLPVDPADPPSAVPLPASLWFFGTALAGLCGVSRRRSAR